MELMAKKKVHRKYRPKAQRQQARPEGPIEQRLKLINQLAPHVSEASCIKERMEQRKERGGDGGSGNAGGGNMVVH